MKTDSTMENIAILKRNEISQLSDNAWDELAEKSTFQNPFYERICLSSALNFLDLEKEIYLVVYISDNQILSLFPIEVYRHFLGYKVISLWKHKHCSLTDPLSIKIATLSEIVDRLLTELKATCFKAERHTPLSMGHFVNKKSIIPQVYRGQISQISDKKDYYSSLPTKVRSESKRIVNRIFSELDVDYRTSADFKTFDWFGAYCTMEHKGWKADVKGSILSRKDYLGYYSNFVPQLLEQEKIHFQGIFHGDVPIAISIRLIARTLSFDIKTSFDEYYKRFYPGVVLEILNLNNLQNSDYESIDSCTQPDNRVINRLWPEQKIIYDSLFFKDSIFGYLLDRTVRLKRKFS